jgi:pSer/pThr/pTyr-binding forkhead associated (FHA) protein
MKIKFSIESPSRFVGVEVPMTHSPFVIGREAGCDLRVDSSTLSARHCAIVVREGMIFVEDYPDKLGTFVNGERIERSRRVHHLDHIQAGKLIFTIQLQLGTLETRGRSPGPNEAASAPESTSTGAGVGRVPRAESAEIAALLLAEDSEPKSKPEAAADTVFNEPSASDTVIPVTPSPMKSKQAAPHLGETAAAAADLLKMFRKHKGAAIVEGTLRARSL